MFNSLGITISKSTFKTGQPDRQVSPKIPNCHQSFYRYSQPPIGYSVVVERAGHLPFSNPPQPQELEAYLGWTTRDVINEMKNLGYSMTLNVPEAVMYLNTDFGRLHFYFEPEQSRINAVVFQG